MSDAATALATSDLEGPGDPKVTIRIGRQGRIWHAVAHIETPHGPMLIHARADVRGVLRAILRSPHLRRWAERISHGAIAPGALDQLAVHAGFSFPNPFKSAVRRWGGQVRRRTARPVSPGGMGPGHGRLVCQRP